MNRNNARAPRKPSLAEQLAYDAVRTSPRPFQRCEHFAIVLIIPATGLTAYSTAAERFLFEGPQGRFAKTNLLDITEMRPASATAKLRAALRKDRVVVLCDDREKFPDIMSSAFDAVVELRSPSVRQVKGTVR